MSFVAETSIPSLDVLSKIKLVATVDFGCGSNADSPSVVQFLLTDQPEKLSRYVELNGNFSEYRDTQLKTLVKKAYVELGEGFVAVSSASERDYLTFECHIPCMIVDEYILRRAIDTEVYKRKVCREKIQYECFTIPLIHSKGEIKPVFYRAWRLVHIIHEYIRLKNSPYAFYKFLEML